MVVTTCPRILTICPELVGADMSTNPAVGEIYTGFPLSSVASPALLLINDALILT